MNPKQAKDFRTKSNIESSRPISLYVHIPFCRQKCRYCGFYSVPLTTHDVGGYVDALLMDMDRCVNGSNVRSIYIGGGTPNSMPGPELLRLTKTIAARCRNCEEFTVELNPENLDLRLLQRLFHNGVNRISFGVQSFNQKELDFLGRNCSAKQILRTLQLARKAGFENINMDLIFAIPASNIQSWKENLKTAISLGIEHLSPYSLSYEPGTPLENDRQAGKIEEIDDWTDRQMYETTIQLLQTEGFEQYEISNFARPGFKCLHNMRYWANKQYIGLGAGASSYIGEYRGTNVKNINLYTQTVKNNQNVVEEIQEVNGLELACQTAVLNLRRSKGIKKNQFQKDTGYDPFELFFEAIEKHRRNGLLKVRQDSIRISRKGLGIADTVIRDFSDVD